MEDAGSPLKISALRLSLTEPGAFSTRPAAVSPSKPHISVPCPSIFFNYLFFLTFLFETGSHYVAQTILELTILLHQLPEYWDYSYVLHTWLCIGEFKINKVYYSLAFPPPQVHEVV